MQRLRCVKLSVSVCVWPANGPNMKMKPSKNKIKRHTQGWNWGDTTTSGRKRARSGKNTAAGCRGRRPSQVSGED